MSLLRWKWPALTRYNFNSCQLLPFTIARLGLPVWPCLFRWGRVCRPTWPTQLPPRPTWPTSRRRIRLSTGDSLTSWAWGTSWRRNICKMEESSLLLRTSRCSGAMTSFDKYLPQICDWDDQGEDVQGRWRCCPVRWLFATFTWLVNKFHLIIIHLQSLLRNAALH